MKQSGIPSGCVIRTQCLHIRPGSSSQEHVVLVHETGIELHLNSQRIMKTQCMAHDLEHMALGFLVCEGILQHRSELQEVAVDTHAGVVKISAQIPEHRLQAASAVLRLASGGSKTGVIDCMQQKVAEGFKIISDATLSAEAVIRLGNEFNHYQGLYRDTKFVHSAALSDGSRILYHAEDVGRHNAVDKVVGFGFLNEIDFAKSVLLCSGRFSLEMVSKAARVGIPLYVSPAAPSVEAVALAQRVGMCLIGRARDDNAIVYASPYRIQNLHYDHPGS